MSHSAGSRLVTSFFRFAHARAGVSDDSLAQHCADMGNPVDRSTITKYRSGDRVAPAWLVFHTLSHAYTSSRDDAAAIASRLLTPVDLMAVPRPYVGDPCGTWSDLPGVVLSLSVAAAKASQAAHIGDGPAVDALLDEAEAHLARARAILQAGAARRAS